MLREKASAFRWGCEKNWQPEVKVMWRIGFRKLNSLWRSICQNWRSCEESAFGSGIHCDEVSIKSGGHVKNWLLEVEFTVTKHLLKVEVMWRIIFYRSGIHCDKASAKSGGHLTNGLLELVFTVTKGLSKVELMWRIGFWNWNSLWRIVCQKWWSCEESASGSGLHSYEGSAKSKGHVKNRLLEVEFTVSKQLPCEAAAACFRQGCIMQNASWPIAKCRKNLCSPHEHRP